jgi:hypothetical protein
MLRPSLFPSSPLRRMIPLCIALALIAGLVLPTTAQEGHSPWAPAAATPAGTRVLDEWIAAAIAPSCSKPSRRSCRPTFRCTTST